MALALSEMVKQYSTTPRGSTSPTFMPSLTHNPSASKPRSTPEMLAFTGVMSTSATVCPRCTRSPMRASPWKTPAWGALSTRSAPWPPTMPG